VFHTDRQTDGHDAGKGRFSPLSCESVLKGRMLDKHGCQLFIHSQKKDLEIF